MNETLDTRQMLAFSALAKRGSFTQAAKDLYVTQSAVSHSIKALEDELGCKLFDRFGRRVQITQAGEQFSRHVDRILLEMQKARSGLDNLSAWGHGRLRVGASTTACQYILPTVLREFRQSFPKCVIKIEPGDHGKQIELLRNGQIDLAIVFEPKDDREFGFVPLFEDQLMFLVSPLHAWARAKKVNRDKIGEETFVMYNQTSYTFRAVLDYFDKDRVTISTFIELGSMEAIKELVKIGLGVGVLAPWIAGRELESGSLISFPLGKRQLTRKWGIGYMKGRRMPLAEETFVGLCRTVTAALGGVVASSED